MTDIQKLRNRIDKIDLAIIKKLAQRKKLSIKIGKWKKKEKQTIKVSTREREMMINYDMLSGKYHLHKSFIKQLFKIIIENSIKLQK